jgi:hypothetical protein
MWALEATQKRVFMALLGIELIIQKLCQLLYQVSYLRFQSNSE